LNPNLFSGELVCFQFNGLKAISIFVIEMKKIIYSIFLITIYCFRSVYAQKYEPIQTREEAVVDTFFNHYIIEDKYRWLENVNSEEVKEWIDKQNKLSDKYLVKAKSAYTIEEWIKIYADVKYDFPVKKGNYYFDIGSQTIYYRKKFNDKPVSLLSIGNSFSKNITKIENISVSHDSKLLAYQYSINGSDRMELRVVSIETGVHKKDHLVGLRFGEGITWRGNGFYYQKYADNEYFEEAPKEDVYYHKIGTDQADDEIVFEKDDPDASFFFYMLEDERYLILYDSNTKRKGMNIYYIDFELESPVLTPLFTNLESKIGIVSSRNGKFIAVTDYKEEMEYFVEIDPHDSYNLKKLTSAYSDAKIVGIVPKKNKLFVQYKSTFNNYLITYDYSGEMLVKLELPPFSSIGEISSGESEDELIYSYTTYTIPPVVYSIDTKTYENKPLDYTLVNFDYTTIEYKQVEYLSKDSVLVPMTLVYEKGIELDGSNPTILYTYGGFGRIEEPSFDPGIVYFVKQGGVFAFAHVRGSGEKGEDWAKQGSGLNKQKTLDDFIAGAEYLIKEGYTNPNKLGITGTSNGGLIVAGSAIQRPDLFKVVVPKVAPLDMLRFEKYTVGKNWIEEYGSINDSIEFENLFSFSPYHNIKESVNYPIMLIMTSEFDDRVPPFHSYKFLSRLQSRPAQTNPVYLSVQENAGHSGTSYTDAYVFIISQLIGNNKKE
jgi:prolyl oligopeptidase